MGRKFSTVHVFPGFCKQACLEYDMTDGGQPVSIHRSVTLVYNLMTPLATLSSRLGLLTLPRASARLSPSLFVWHDPLHVSRLVPVSQRSDLLNQVFTGAFSLERFFLPFILPEFQDRCGCLAPVLAALWESRDGGPPCFSYTCSTQRWFALVPPTS